MGQFLNCVYGSLRIVLLTIQELSKAQCNYTDNNNNDYSDTDPFLSDLKNMMRLENTNETEERITHNIFYTAITRAKENLKIYWSPETEKSVLGRLEVRDSRRDANLLKQLYSL